MDRKRRFFALWKPPPDLMISPTGPKEELAEIEFEMTSALAQALEGRATTSQIVEHCRRVSKLACAIGALVELRPDEEERLRRAAQLHEIGMVGVPGDLLVKRTKLSADELARVRAQARVGAEIVRASHDFATARLIERQYDDYIAIRQTTVDSREVLLSGLLRVADVYDAMTAPRPYQPPLQESQWRQVLQLGSGSKFHPAAVYALFRWADGSRSH